jgi:ribosomal protein S18 acetylase RimI-like enzyme
MRSLVRDPSTASVLNNTPESAEAELRRIWDEGLDAKDLRHFMAASQDQGNRIGYLRVLYPFGSDDCLWLAFMAVAPALRGMGFGRKVLGLLLAGARDNPPIRKVGMHAIRTNVHAVRLYKSLGFECVKQEPWDNTDGTKRERLTLVLDLARKGTA